MFPIQLKSEQLFLLVILILSLIVAGCASFPDYKIPKIESIAINKDSIQRKPTLYISIKYKSASTFYSNDIKEYDAPEIRRIVEKTANKLAIFQTFSFESLQNKNVDYVLKIEMLNYGSGDIYTGDLRVDLLLLVIPHYITLNYILNAKLYDNNNKLIKKYTYTDTMKIWLGILVAPLAINTFSDARDEVLENMFKALFSDLVKDNTIFRIK